MARSKAGSRKNGGGNGNGNGKATRSMAERVIAQGVGTVPKHAFAHSGDLPEGQEITEKCLDCWDARTLCHLPLPRSVGPYTVIRITKRFQSTLPCLVFGTFYQETLQRWTNISAIGPVDSQGTIGGTLNAQQFTAELNLGPTATCVPSALTVQVLNPTALQAAEGVMYHGISTVQAEFGGDVLTWENRFDQFVQYQAPRMLSGGKLALRGTQTSSYPLNMNAVSEFTSLDIEEETTFTWNASLRPRGFAPILMYNIDGAELEYLVTTEWRVRFDLSNPASAGHSKHGLATDHQWDDLISLAAARGAGVMDIPDVAATGGVRYN